MSLPTSYNNPINLGIIGGTGMYNINNLKVVAQLFPETPWGKPSSPLIVAETRLGFPLVFLARHGIEHSLFPSEVPFQANIAAMKKVGVRVIIAFSSVGSLQEEIPPMDFIVPTQLIDLTKGLRPSTFFGKGVIRHVAFGQPFDVALNDLVCEYGINAMPHGKKLHTKKNSSFKNLTLVCMEGPAFSTQAESQLYRSWNAVAVNMSAIPEAKLAKEAEISYQMICMSTDYDAWKEDEEPVTVEKVMTNLQTNSETANSLLHALLDPLEQAINSKAIGYNLEGTMEFFGSKTGESSDPEMTKALHFLFPDYW